MLRFLPDGLAVRKWLRLLMLDDEGNLPEASRGSWRVREQ